MPEKLLTLEEVSVLLGISVQEVEKLVENGELPAYKVGGQYLRFRKEQIEAIRAAIQSELGQPQEGTSSRRDPDGLQNLPRSQPSADRVFDFFYFNDFYIAATLVILLILWVIFK